VEDGGIKRDILIIRSMNAKITSISFEIYGSLLYKPNHISSNPPGQKDGKFETDLQ